MKIKKIEVGLYALAIKESEVEKCGKERFKALFYSTKTYFDRHTFAGYVVLMYEWPEVRDISLVLARVLGYRTAVEIPDIVMVEGRSLKNESNH